MKIQYSHTDGGYENCEISLKGERNFQCPRCGCQDFEVWFTMSNRIDLTCCDCAGFVQIFKITEEPDDD